MDDQELQCLECTAWDLTAKMHGYSSGMCEECFNKICHEKQQQ